jgi:hypothetical protein
MMRGGASERPEADGRIARVPLPESDPVFGKYGPRTRLWEKVEGAEPLGGWAGGVDGILAVTRTTVSGKLGRRYRGKWTIPASAKHHGGPV